MAQCLLTPPAALLPAADPPLQSPATGFEPARVGGRVNVAIAVGNLAGVHVDADGMAVVGRFLDRDREAYDRVPFATRALEHCRDGLAVVVRVAALAPDRHAPERRDVQAVVRDHHAGADADAVEIPAAPEAREAWSFTGFQPAKERLAGEVETPECAPLDRERARRHPGNVPAALGQPLALVEVRQALACLAVAVDPLLECRVVELPLVFERALKPSPVRRLLRPGSSHAIFS